MEVRKVYLTKRVAVGHGSEDTDILDAGRICYLFSLDDVSAVVVLARDVDLTVGQVRMIERMFRAIWKENVQVIY